MQLQGRGRARGMFVPLQSAVFLQCTVQRVLLVYRVMYEQNDQVPSSIAHLITRMTMCTCRPMYGATKAR